MSVRMQLKGELHDLKMKKLDLQTKARRKIESAREILAPVLIRRIEEIDLEGAVMYLQEALEHKKELIDVLEKIKKIEAELND